MLHGAQFFDPSPYARAFAVVTPALPGIGGKPTRVEFGNGAPATRASAHCRKQFVLLATASGCSVGTFHLMRWRHATGSRLGPRAFRRTSRAQWREHHLAFSKQQCALELRALELARIPLEHDQFDGVLLTLVQTRRGISRHDFAIRYRPIDPCSIRRGEHVQIRTFARSYYRRPQHGAAGSRLKSRVHFVGAGWTDRLIALRTPQLAHFGEEQA